MYLGGLVVFTVASLWCGLAFELSASIWMLVAARVLQGFGAAMVAPQTMAVITRIFPRESRGSAMSLWGATAGVATLVGPILGGVLVDAAGWEWIFFINIPVGVVGFWLAWRLVPTLEVHEHSFDWLGVVLSGVALLLLVFGIQEGHAFDWNATIVAMIVGGLRGRRRLRLVAVAQHARAADAAVALPRPQLLARQHRDREPSASSSPRWASR